MAPLDKTSAGLQRIECTPQPPKSPSPHATVPFVSFVFRGCIPAGRSEHGFEIHFGHPTNVNDWVPAGNSEHAAFSPLNAQQQAAATLALQLWDDLISPTIVANGSDPHSTIKLSNLTTSDSYAYGYYPDQGGWEGSSAWFNMSYRDLAAPAPGNYANMAFIHELGHTLGLGHTNLRTDVMYPVQYSTSPTWSLGFARGLVAIGKAAGCRTT